MPTNDDRQKKSRKQNEAGEAAFEAIDWGEGPEFIKRDLLGAWFLHRSDPKTTQAAFEALYMLSQYWWDDEVKVPRPDPDFGLDPLTTVPVPWWAIHLIGHCWRRYINSPEKTLGEAFLLEGGGKGKRKVKTRFDQQLREKLLTLEIAYLQKMAAKQRPRKSVETIIHEVSDEYGLAEDTVRGYWKKHGKDVKLALNRNLAKKG